MSEELSQATEAPVAQIDGVAVRPQLALEVIGSEHGLFGAKDAGDTTGFDGLSQVITLAPAAVRPYGGWFDAVVDDLIEDLRKGGLEPSLVIDMVVL